MNRQNYDRNILTISDLKVEGSKKLDSRFEVRLSTRALLHLSSNTSIQPRAFLVSFLE
jgi:hypothetical protein